MQFGKVEDHGGRSHLYLDKTHIVLNFKNGDPLYLENHDWLECRGRSEWMGRDGLDEVSDNAERRSNSGTWFFGDTHTEITSV